MSEKTQPNIKQTLFEKVLIKSPILSADKYCRAVVKQAHKKANAYYQTAIQEKNEIYNTAYQNGYNNGIKQLLSNFINTIENSEKQYQEKIQTSEALLVQRLTEFFTDERLHDIIVHYFKQQRTKLENVTLYLPSKMQKQFRDTMPDISLKVSTSNTIALEIDNKITYFSPTVATNNILPHVFSVSTRCNLLKEQKDNYQKMIELINLSSNQNEDNTTD
ncbi:hypothetical protein C9446_00765 [Providencia heimbachae]|uniref:hypothetical protein n=1 Tax=Providencia heimbachae TaxID=333962 RepID=UPI0010BF2C4C|nr:hypothetical protein [Providencia heimbachae]QCJ68526.1 hypothetical protein C9446_00765 [Providencia heimbachae]